MKREEEIKHAACEYINSDVVRPENMYLAYGDFVNGAQWSDEHPSVETMLKLFWFFDKHGLIKEDLCFDPEHFMETVAEEFLPAFDMEEYFKNRK